MNDLFIKMKSTNNYACSTFSHPVDCVITFLWLEDIDMSYLYQHTNSTNKAFIANLPMSPLVKKYFKIG